MKESFSEHAGSAAVRMSKEAGRSKPQRRSSRPVGVPPSAAAANLSLPGRVYQSPQRFNLGKVDAPRSCWRTFQIAILYRYLIYCPLYTLTWNEQVLSGASRRCHMVVLARSQIPLSSHLNGPSRVVKVLEGLDAYHRDYFFWPSRNRNCRGFM